MSIQDCLILPVLLSKLPEVGYSIMNKGINLKARAAHILADWDAILSDTFCSAMVFKFSEDWESVMVGVYYA